MKAHDPEENTWENRLRSLQSKLTNTKSRKLEALEIQFHRQMSTENENTIEKQLNENKKETTIDKSTNISILKDGKTFFRCISEYRSLFSHVFSSGSCAFVNCFICSLKFPSFV
jgi:hypothetical protein